MRLGGRGPGLISASITNTKYVYYCLLLPLFRKLVLITLALMAAMISPHPCCPSVVLVQALVGVEVMVGDYQFVWLPNDSVWEEGEEVEEV